MDGLRVGLHFCGFLYLQFQDEVRLVCKDSH